MASRESISSTSHINDSGRASAGTDEDEFELEDIYKLLKSRLQALTVSTQEQKEILENNVLPQPIGETEWPLDVTCRYAKCLLKVVKEQVPSDWPRHRAHALLENDQSLTKQIDGMAEIIQKSLKEIEELNTENTRMENEIKLLQTIAKQRDTKGEMHQDTELEEKLNIVKREFKKCRLLLVNSLEDLFDDDDTLKDILSDLVNSFFSTERDSYIDISSDGSLHPYIAMLLDSGVIIRHPYDHTKIRLADLK